VLRCGLASSVLRCGLASSVHFSFCKESSLHGFGMGGFSFLNSLLHGFVIASSLFLGSEGLQLRR
jgi:hypothetical protein